MKKKKRVRRLQHPHNEYNCGFISMQILAKGSGQQNYKMQKSIMLHAILEQRS